MSSIKLTKIMLVEDEPDIATIAKYALEKRGKFIVKHCVSGKDALNQVESFSPDLILLDVMMPDMDGIATFKELRKIVTIKDTPIVFMTAKAQASEIMEYKALGITDIITKPFNSIGISDEVRKIWETHRINMSLIRHK